MQVVKTRSAARHFAWALAGGGFLLSREPRLGAPTFLSAVRPTPARGRQECLRSRFMAREQVRKAQGAPHEPERGCLTRSTLRRSRCGGRKRASPTSRVAAAGPAARRTFMAAMRDSGIVEASHEPGLGAPTFLSALGRTPARGRQECLRSGFLAPMRDSATVEAFHEPHGRARTPLAIHRSPLRAGPDVSCLRRAAHRPRPSSSCSAVVTCSTTRNSAVHRNVRRWT
jgi:hypothetical protein